MKNNSKSATKKSAKKNGRKAATNDEKSSALFREGFESMLVAILLALLFRGFEAEAFIIPTGSMAPTLQGMHKDLRCPECDFRYRTNKQQNTPVRSTTCPMCRFETQIDQEKNPSFNGDRIIVNKFAYEVDDPERWDVIVFHFPGNAKQNYIKRLVGLPGETLKIRGGDVFAKGDGGEEFKILRKPPAKIPYTLQKVHDTRYVPEKLIKSNWPSRWHLPGDAASDGDWQISEDQNEYVLKPTDENRWLRYRHLPPVEWNQWNLNNLRAPKVPARLIRDWYAYNAGSPPSVSANGLHWVGDLAVEAAVEITTPQGELWLDLVEGGQNYRCQIDVETGVATCSIPDGPVLTAQTPIRGKDKYRVMWGNLDDQVLLWVDGEAMPWTADGQSHPGHYTNRGLVNPKWSPDEPGDLLPAGIGGKNIGLTASNLKIFRDIYYTAVYATKTQSAEGSDYKSATPQQARMVLQQVQTALLYPPPSVEGVEDLFSDRRETIEFSLEEDQFFPMGDNSPASKDGRLWAKNGSVVNPSEEKYVDNFVERDLLIGKAIIVYWPHGWPLGPVRLPVNPIPNVDRMGKIR